MSVGTPYNICENPSDKIKAIKELELLTTINPAIKNIALCYQAEPNNVISVSGTMTVDSFARLYMDGTWDGVRLKSELAQTIDARLVLTDSSVDKYVNPQQFLYIANMPFGQENGFGHIIFVLNDDFLARTMEDNLKNYDHFIQISDENGQSYLLTSNVEERISTIQDARSEEIQKDYMVLSEKIDYGYTYTIGIRKTQLYYKIERIWRNSIVVLSIFSILGVLLAFFISENLYRPIRRISEIIGRKKSSENELKFISNSIGGLIDVKNKAENIIGDVKSQLFDNLLYHDIHDEKSVMGLFDFARVQFDCPYFCVLKISFPGFGEEQLQLKKEQLSLFLKNDDIHILHLILQTNCICLIINSESNDLNHIKNVASQSVDFISTSHISIGSVVLGIFKTHQSYEEATFVLTCDFFDSQNSILTIDEVMKKINNNYVYPKVEETKLISSILSTNIEQVHLITQNIFDKFKREKTSPKILWGIYVSMINNIKNALETEGFNLSETVYSIKHFTTNDYSGYTELNENFKELIAQFIAIAASEKGNENSNIIKAIYDYINANFESYNISLNAVAGEIGLSPSYTTKLFREATGYSVKEYIDRKKMQKAKALLNETNLSLSEISQQVGFLDTQSFCRKFKSMEGVSPNSYKRK